MRTCANVRAYEWATCNSSHTPNVRAGSRQKHEPRQQDTCWPTTFITDYMFQQFYINSQRGERHASIEAFPDSCRLMHPPRPLTSTDPQLPSDYPRPCVVATILDDARTSTSPPTISCILVCALYTISCILVRALYTISCILVCALYTKSCILVCALYTVQFGHIAL